MVAPPPLGDGYDLQLVAQNRAHVPHVNHSAAQKVVDLAEAAQTTARANANDAHRLELAILALAQVTPEILAQRKRTAARKKQNEIDWRWMQRKGAKMGDGNEVVVIVYKTKGVYVGYAKRGKKGEVVRHGLGVLREVSVASPPSIPLFPSFTHDTHLRPYNHLCRAAWCIGGSSRTTSRTGIPRGTSTERTSTGTRARCMKGSGS